MRRASATARISHSAPTITAKTKPSASRRFTVTPASETMMSPRSKLRKLRGTTAPASPTEDEAARHQRQDRRTPRSPIRSPDCPTAVTSSRRPCAWWATRRAPPRSRSWWPVSSGSTTSPASTATTWWTWRWSGSAAGCAPSCARTTCWRDAAGELVVLLPCADGADAAEVAGRLRAAAGADHLRRCPDDRRRRRAAPAHPRPRRRPPRPCPRAAARRDRWVRPHPGVAGGPVENACDDGLRILRPGASACPKAWPPPRA